MLTWLKRSFLALVGWIGKFGDLTLMVTIIVRGLTIWVVVVVLYLGLTRLNKRWLLHNGIEKLSAEG